MAETKQVSINRDFMISGYLSGQAFRVAVRVDTTATRLIRLALKDFSKARALEQEIVDALSLFDEGLKSVRKELDKANRRRREGVPGAGMKQDYVVRTMVSAQAFRSAVMVDQIQRDLTLLSLAGSPQIAVIADKAQKAVSDSLQSLDSVVASVSKALDEENDRARKRRKEPGKPKNTAGSAEKRVGTGSDSKPTPDQADKVTTKNTSAQKAKNEDKAPSPQSSGTTKKTPAKASSKVAEDSAVQSSPTTKAVDETSKKPAEVATTGTT